MKESNNNNNKKPPPNDGDAKSRARAQARAVKPGAVSVAADEAARLDQRITDKQQPQRGGGGGSNKAASRKTPPDALNRLEQDVHAKRAAAAASSEHKQAKPGAVAVSRNNVKNNSAAQLDSLENEVTAKTRAAAAGGAHTALNDLEDRINAKVNNNNNNSHNNTASSPRRSPRRTAAPGAHAALNDLEDRINSKVRTTTTTTHPPHQPGASPPARRSPRHSSAAAAGLDQLENRIAAKMQTDNYGNNNNNNKAREQQLQDVEDAVLSKKQAARRSPQDSLRPPEKASAKFGGHRTTTTTTTKTAASLKKGDEDEAPLSPAGKKSDNYHNPEHSPDKASDEYNADPLAAPGSPPPRGGVGGGGGMMNGVAGAGASDLEYGVYDPDNTEGLAVAVPVVEEEDDVFIPSAVEYDPDAKPPLYRNRRFRLYTFLAVFVLAIVAIGAGVGISLGKQEEYDPNQKAYREDLGINETVAALVGADVLEDASSPYTKALRWLTFRDQRELTPDDPNFLQRYIMAYFYYATSAEEPWFSCNPPKDNQGDICDFSQLSLVNPIRREITTSTRWLTAGPECTWAGVFCDQFEQIRAIDLSKCLVYVRLTRRVHKIGV